MLHKKNFVQLVGLGPFTLPIKNSWIRHCMPLSTRIMTNNSHYNCPFGPIYGCAETIKANTILWSCFFSMYSSFCSFSSKICGENNHVESLGFSISKFWAMINMTRKRFGIHLTRIRQSFGGVGVKTRRCKPRWLVYGIIHVSCVLVITH
jgi:hypothetical protein